MVYMRVLLNVCDNVELVGYVEHVSRVLVRTLVNITKRHLLYATLKDLKTKVPSPLNLADPTSLWAMCPNLLWGSLVGTNNSSCLSSVLTHRNTRWQHVYDDDGSNGLTIS